MALKYYLIYDTLCFNKRNLTCTEIFGDWDWESEETYQVFMLIRIESTTDPVTGLGETQMCYYHGFLTAFSFSGVLYVSPIDHTVQKLS